MDVDDGYGSTGGGGSSGGGHFGGYPQPPFSPPPSGPNYPNQQQGPGYNSFGPGPNYGPSNYGPPPPNYPTPSYGPDSGGWERAADAYKELADARQQYAALAGELGDARAKEADLRARIRERDRAIDDAENQIKALQLERDQLVKEVSRLNDELKPFTARRGPGFSGPRFVPHGHDEGWGGSTRGRPRADTELVTGTANIQTPPGPAIASATAATTMGTRERDGTAQSTAPPRAQGGNPKRATTRAPARDATAAAAATPPDVVAAPATAPPTQPLPQPTAHATRPTAQSMGVDEFEWNMMTEAERENHGILRRQGQMDVMLEASGQPLSAWYRCWSSPPVSMAESYEAMEQDDEGDTDEAGDNLSPGIDLVFSDPITSFASQLTKAAHVKEVNRAARARGVDTIEPLPPADDPEFGAWAGTNIQTVVQAHNLRWWAFVEWDEDALRFYKFVTTIYQRPAHVRPEGIRYLQKLQGADAARRKQHLRRAIPRPVNAPRDHLGRYPEAAADIDVVCRFFRCASVNTWPPGMRLASGALPSGDGFGVPLSPDCRAFFLLWHLLPQRAKKNPHREHDARIRTLAMELFSIPGWYERIVAAGEFVGQPQEVPIRYPYPADDASPILLSAWFCTHGVALDRDVIASIRHWATRSRNESLGRVLDDTSPWPAPPIDVDSVTSAAEIALVVKYDELAWGTRLLETHESNHGDFDELDDGEDI